MYLLVIVVILIGGCDERATRIAREAADRQAQQNTAMADLNREVASGTRHLIDADSQARKEIVSVHRDLQAERARLDTSWNVLEVERRKVAHERRRDSMLASMAVLVGAVLIVALLLGFCWYALVAAKQGDAEAEELNQLVIHELLGEGLPLLKQHRPTVSAPLTPDNRQLNGPAASRQL
jgi:hypothetical protein